MRLSAFSLPAFCTNRLRPLRERGWTAISAADYSAAWARWGGSVATHPDVVSRLSALAEIPVDYFGWFAGDELQAAIPTWGRHLALAREVLKKTGKRGVFDLGNAEILLPVAPQSRGVALRHRAHYLGALHADQIATLRPQREQLMLARAPEAYGKKFLYNQRRERRLLEENGGQIVPLQDVPAEDIAAMYELLFEKRWGFAVPGKHYLARVFSALRPFMVGHLIRIDGQPAAIQIVYRVEAPGWLSAEYINGGVDPACNALGPGSVLTFVNTQSAWEEARALGKALRYSFGRADREYKARWCHSVPVFATG